MYLDVTSPTSNLQLTFKLGTEQRTRTWRIKVALLPCGASYLGKIGHDFHGHQSSRLLISLSWGKNPLFGSHDSSSAKLPRLSAIRRRHVHLLLRLLASRRPRQQSVQNLRSSGTYRRTGKFLLPTSESSANLTQVLGQPKCPVLCKLT